MKKINDFNDRLGLAITKGVGTMWCAYAFAALALISLPQAINQGTAALVAWTAQTFLQLVLLAVLMVGQKQLEKSTDQAIEHILSTVTGMVAPLAESHDAVAGLVRDLHDLHIGTNKEGGTG